MGAPFIAAAIRKAEDEVVDQLRAAGATSAANARPLPPLRRIAQGRLDRLMSADVIRQVSPGQYYLDEPEYLAYRNRKRTIALTIAITAAVLGGILMRWTANHAR
ncbi:MAG: hypothetical protein H0U85_01890 [Gemmatimonadales bacterium]|nr:hypothetical protein [Gemmatimonadales bacterium]